MSALDYFVHESSYVDADVEIGPGTKIWHFSHILSGAKIGRNCIIGQNVCVERGVTIGNGCKLQNNVSVYKGVILEDEVFCGPSCVFTNVYNPRAFIERKHEYRSTLVKTGATIGANATIVCGATIGKYALIAAGAVVKSDVSDHAVVAGVPARQIGWACKCGTPLRSLTSDSKHRTKEDSFAEDDLPDLSESVKCEYCGNEYALKEGRLIETRESSAYMTNPGSKLQS